MRRFISAIVLLGAVLTVPFFTAHGATSIATNVVIRVIPNAPSGLGANASSQSEIDLSWTDNSNNESGFSIERSMGSDINFAVIATTSANVAVYSDTGLAADTLYYYRVAAYGSGGYSPYSNEASTTTPSAPLPPPPSGGSSGGGSGGGYSPPPTVFQTSAIFRGYAYPSSDVTLLENGQVVAVTQAGPDAKFEVDLSDMAPGSYNFGVWALDPAGTRSLTQTFLVSVTNGATTVVSGIFFAPTIGTDKIQIKQGNVLTILGYTAPEVTVTVMVHSPNEIMQNVTSSGSGAWFYDLPTDDLAFGNHTVAARAALPDGEITTDSNFVTFAVGNEDVTAPAPQSCPTAAEGDLNGDCKINLIDFSILAYWYGRPSPPAIVLLDHTENVDLTDFSILAYNWTG